MSNASNPASAYSPSALRVTSGSRRLPSRSMSGTCQRPVSTRGTSSPGPSSMRGGRSGRSAMARGQGNIGRQMVPEVVTLAPGFVVSRMAKGNWQLAERHGAPYAREAAIDDMRRFVEAGITLFDCADHYVGVEQLIGEFRRRHPDHARRLRVSTKLVPDLESLPHLTRRDVERIVDTSLARLGQERLDLVQFHWWDYRVPGYVEAMHWLADLKSAGKVELIGTTNFDTARLSEIVASGVSLATNQLQYSVLDHRPQHGLAAFFAAHGIRLLCYGTLAGGFIAERWLGAPEPQPPFANRSLVKYRLIVDDFGGWRPFQELLAVLDAIATRHRVSVASVAIRYVLDKP